LVVIASGPPVVSTGSGDPVTLTPRSVATITVEVAVAVLLPGTGSPPEFATVTLSVRIVPFAAFVGTAVITSMLAADPTAKPDAVHVTTFAAFEQLHPEGAVNDWNVVPAGRVSVIVTVPDTFGPLFVTVWEKTTVLPASTFTGEAWSATLRSVPDEATFTEALAVLLAGYVSAGVEAIVAVSVMVVPPVICTTVANVKVAPETMLATVHVTVVVPEHDHEPPGFGNVTRVVFAGTGSVYTKLVALLGPV
jgi:hypothetical protein